MAVTRPAWSRADQHPPAPVAVGERWRAFGESPMGTAHVVYPDHLGFRVEEVREGYCRMRMPFRPELMHAGGVVHGGALASLLDTVLVPAIGSLVDPDSTFSTVDLHVQYLAPLGADDGVAEGWVVRRGGRIVFGRAEVRAAATGDLVATAVLTYHVAPPRH